MNKAEIEEFNTNAFKQLIVPFKDYAKEVKTSLNTLNDTIKQTISNGYNFCNTSIDITKKVSITYMMEEEGEYIRTTEESTIYPESIELHPWLIENIKKITEIKELNPQAIENMKKRGIVPKRQTQAGDILLLLTGCSRTEIHIIIYIPVNMNEFNIIDFVHSTIGEKQSFVIDGQFAFINFTDEYPLKKRDEIIQLFFNKLKELNIYVVEEEDDECIFDL
jgi:hypothetical protein